MTEAGALYATTVMHRRRVAPLYTFDYRLQYLLLDLDRLPELHAQRRWFSRGRFNLVSFHERDHGDGSGDLRGWVTRLLAARGVAAPARIRLLALPRVLGFAFNPISLYWCEDAGGALRAAIAEVNNTFGERHSYVLHADGAPIGEGALAVDKRLHVSPFFPVEGRYAFRLAAPGERVRVFIEQQLHGRRVLEACLHGERRPLTDRALLGLVLGLPLQALKVLTAIHWQALKIWLRGATFHSKPVPPATEFS
ncbi:MAG TPA: DUF1365 domain-containing protein [Candidatus Binatia bacterium]|nr:DUF1365 domain-containing protein [Candidatus Binatia bacterium]